MLTSPLLRASQTARILQKRAGWPAAVPSEALQPGRELEETLRVLREQTTSGSVALVGHEPHLGELAAFLLYGQDASARLEFKKGGVAKLSFDGDIAPGAARLCWLATPKILRSLAL